MASQYLRRLNSEDYKQLTLKLHKMQNGCCFICQRPIDISIHSINIDHIVPLNMGGKDHECNFALTHESCNKSKKDANLSDARSLAYEVHKDQVDKGGAPYYSHPDRVAKRCETEDEKIVAYLHDTIEDTEVTPELLEEKGFSKKIIDAVLSVTKIEGESYEEFVARAKQNPIGRMVKIHDLEDNMDVSRLPELDDKAVERLRKYLKAYHFLKED